MSAPIATPQIRPVRLRNRSGINIRVNSEPKTDKPVDLYPKGWEMPEVKFGEAPAVYALEGSIAITGALVQWLRDNLGLIRSSAEVEDLAKTVEDSGGIYFVPAFSGLFAPYWRSDARGVIVGLTRYIDKGHLARAVLEATAYQTREVRDLAWACFAPPLLVTRELGDGADGAENCRFPLTASRRLW